MDEILRTIIEGYGLIAFFAVMGVYGLYKILLTVAPDLMKKIKLFPRRQKIVDKLEDIAEKMSTVTRMTLEGAERNADTLTSMNSFIDKLDIVLSNLQVLGANVELLRETIKEMQEFKKAAECDQLRKIQLRLRIMTYEQLFNTMRYMILNEGETNSLKGHELEDKLDQLLKTAYRVLEDHVKSEVYTDLSVYEVPALYITTLDKVLFELGFLRAAVMAVKPTLRMKGTVTERIDGVRVAVENFHFNVVGKMEKLLGITVTNGGVNNRRPSI